MAWADLTAEQQQDAQQFDEQLRGLFVSVQKVLRDADFTNLKQFYTGTVAPILGTLGTAEEVPRTSSLAMADDLEVGELQTLVGLVNTLDSGITNNLALVVKAAGVNSGA